MALAIVNSCALKGIEAVNISLEVNITVGSDLKFVIVGLPDAAIRESCDRISAALINCDFKIPHARTTVNLAPSDIRKEGCFYDLPIALGVIHSSGQRFLQGLEQYIIAGELGLSGNIRSIKGGLAFAIQAKREHKKLILPTESAMEAAFVDGVEIYAVDHLREVIGFFCGEEHLDPVPHRNLLKTLSRTSGVDFAEVKGQFAIRRAVEVAVAGGHNLLMIGSPGSGKSMIAKRIPTIMPDQTFDEFLETMSIYSAAGLPFLFADGGATRPFRSPHHSISRAGLLGGGSIPGPGELSLAHHGVLFLDELAEYEKGTIDALRQPLEDGKITISRTSGKVTFPCSTMVVGAMNPCPCGYYGDRTKQCRCSQRAIMNYRSRISGPILDRFDIQVHVSAVPIEAIQSNKPSESSATIKERVEKAFQMQCQRFNGTLTHMNAGMSHAELMQYCHLTDDSLKLLREAMKQLSLSARAYDKIIKVARTIADLEQSELIETGHILESIQYRSLDRWL